MRYAKLNALSWKNFMGRGSTIGGFHAEVFRCFRITNRQMFEQQFVSVLDTANITGKVFFANFLTNINWRCLRQKKSINNQLS